MKLNQKLYQANVNAHHSKSLPVFGTTHPTDFPAASAEINNTKPNTATGVEKIAQFTNSQLPEFLKTGGTARDFLKAFPVSAIGTGRYFTLTPNDFGTSAKFAFLDGECSPGDGADLLVVTGKLTASDNVVFNEPNPVHPARPRSTASR